jgi:hypothetical protein
MSLIDRGENPDQVYVAVTATNMKGGLKLQRSYAISKHEDSEYNRESGSAIPNHDLQTKPDDISLWRAYVSIQSHHQER